MKKKVHLNNNVVLTADSTTKSIQIAFNRIYPFLKIEFFKRTSEKVSQKSVKVDSGKPILHFSELSASLNMSIQPATTVLQLEQIINELFGLNVQLYRKAGSGWVETLLTEHWTLEQQNEEGRSFSLPAVNLTISKKEGPPTSYRSE